MALEDEAPPHVVDQILTGGWKQAEILEVAGYLLFPDKIYKRKPDGSFEEIPILLRVPREHEFRQARVKTRQLALEDNLDLDRDGDLVENLESVVLLSMAIRNPKPPMHEPWEPDPRALEKHYDRTSIAQLWSKLDKLSALIDPAPDTISAEEIVALMAALARERHLGPLVAYGSGAQTTFILTMVDQLSNSQPQKSSSAPPALSTPAS